MLLTLNSENLCTVYTVQLHVFPSPRWHISEWITCFCPFTHAMFQSSFKLFLILWQIESLFDSTKTTYSQPEQLCWCPTSKTQHNTITALSHTQHQRNIYTCDIKYRLHSINRYIYTLQPINRATPKISAHLMIFKLYDHTNQSFIYFRKHQ